MTNSYSEKINKGLTDEQVREKISQGLVNNKADTQSKSYSKIICDNLFSLFNLINTILLVCIIISGSYKNGLFYLVVLWNFLIGTIQEIRAKRVIEKLSLISSPKAKVIRNKDERLINVDEIVLGDILKLNAGDQICADSIVLEGNCQVNESLITGESTAILKQADAQLLSGSFLISGQVIAEVIHVGNDNYVNKITHDAAYYKKPDSVIMKSLKWIIRWIVIIIIPLTGLFVWNNFFNTGLDFSSAMVKTVAGVSAMIPGGLILLVTIILSVSVIRLSKHHTMVRDLFSVENLARVDTLLLDKTGTITEGTMTVETVLEVGNTPDVTNFALKNFIEKSTDSNSTITAIRDYLNDTDSAVKGDYTFIPFSSDTKMSILIEEGKGTYVLGAPEFVLGEELGNYIHLFKEYMDHSYRVVVFAFSDICSDVSNIADVKLPDSVKPLCFIVIGDRVRKDAPETLGYFREQDVDIKVISGDSPSTVSQIARDAGLLNWDKYIDASELKNSDEISEAADKYTVFGRVTPHQKKEIVKALQSKGHVVAMTGDGANDVLALKEADCSIAMQSGTDAAKNVANIVLLDSNFSSLPLVVAEGRKAINNLQRSSALYLIKTVYSLILTVLFILTVKITYPFESIQLTILGALTIGIPSFFLALEPDIRRIRKGFLRNIAITAIPTGIMEAAALIAFLFIAQYSYGAAAKELSSASSYLMIIMGLIVIFDICGRLNLYKGLLILLLALAGVLAYCLFPALFSFVPLKTRIWVLLLIVAGIFFIIHFIVFRIVLRKRNN